MTRSRTILLVAVVLIGTVVGAGVFATPVAAQDGELSFGDQATASSTIASDDPSTPGVVVEDVAADSESAVVVTYEQSGLEDGDAVSIDLDNVGSSAWEVNGVSGATDDISDVVVEDVENPTLVFVEGVEYTFEDLPGSVHPLEFFDADGTPLLSQDGDGTFEDETDVDWSDDENEVSFVATGELVDALDGYVCTIHGAMEGETTSNDLVIAGLDTFGADELNGDDVTIGVEDTGGFPGDHVAHLIPVDQLSSEYAPGDAVSAETADAIVDNEAATVFQGTVELEDQDIAEGIEEGDVIAEVATANLLDGAEDGTPFVVDIHPTDEDNALVGDQFVGASNVLTGENDDVEIIAERVPDDGEFNELPLEDADDFVAMIHIVDDDAAEGDQASPGSYPVLQHADADDGFVAGGITDQGTLTVEEDADDDDDGLPGFGIPAAIAALIGVLWYRLRR